jgi:hypothetical protein
VSQITIPNITPVIDIDATQSVMLILSSIAFEELALAHIINAEAEKLQFVVEVENGTSQSSKNLKGSNLSAVNNTVEKTLQTVVQQGMLLQFKLGNAMDLMDKIQKNVK